MQFDQQPAVIRNRIGLGLVHGGKLPAQRFAAAHKLLQQRLIFRVFPHSFFLFQKPRDFPSVPILPSVGIF